MTPSSSPPPRDRSYGALATFLALLCLVAPDSVGRPALALFLFGGAALGVLPFVLVDLLGARLATGPASASLLRRIATLLLAAPLVLLAARVAGFPELSALSLALPAGLLVAAFAAFAVNRLAARLGAPDDPRFWLAVAVAAGELMALFFYLQLAEGTFAAVRPGAGALHAALYFGTWLASLALLLPWAGRIYSRGGLLTTSRWWVAWTALAALIGVGALYADRRYMVGLYPAAHVWLEYVGVLSLDAALARGLAAAQSGRQAGPARLAKLLRRLSALALALLMLAAAGFAVVAFGGYAGDRGFRAQVADTAVGPTLLRWTRHVAARAREPQRTIEYPRYHDVPPPQNDWNVILLSVDTLRGDALPDPEDPDKSAAPQLSALASTCVDFRRAYAPGSRTAIGMGALMLGRYSAHIQWDLWIWDGKLIDPKKATAQEINRFSDGVQYTTIPQIPPEGNLAQRLQAAGLRTLATPWDGYSRFFRKGNGFDPGFDEYTDMNSHQWTEPASPEVLALALEQLDSVDGKRFFQWIHLFDPHESKGDRARYGELVKTMDEAIGEFLDGLEQRGLRDNTVIVLVADHGEALGDHRNQTHGTSLYEEQVRVPMLICLPDRPGKVFRRPVSTLDATATILALAGADLTGIDGVNLLPLIEADTYPAERPVFTELHRYQSRHAERTTDMQAVILDDWKLIRDLKNDTAQLFNLAADPREQASVLADFPDIAADLEDLLEALTAEIAGAKPPPPLFAARPAAFDPSEDSVLLWARTTLPATIHFELSTSPRYTDPITTPPTRVDNDQDNVHVAEVTGLSPGTRYWYRAVITHDGQTKNSDSGNFKTAPEVARSVRIAWSADLTVEQAPFKIFNIVKREKPDLFLMLGDTVNADAPVKGAAEGLAGFRQRHWAIRADALLQSFLSSTATAAIWDDREIADNAHRNTEHLDLARQAFREQWPVRSADPDGRGLYRSLRPAPQVEVFMLDLRSFRDPPRSRLTMLGDAQKDWLITALKSSTARTKIVVSSVPLFAGFGDDSWAGFPGEREELRALFASEPPGSVLVLSGDYHLAWHLVDPVTGVHELVAGPLAGDTFDKVQPDRTTTVTSSGRFSLLDTPNFGVLDIAPDGGVTARYFDLKGKEKYRVALATGAEAKADAAP
jgi:arylsulfatase A-like enzyme